MKYVTDNVSIIRLIVKLVHKWQVEKLTFKIISPKNYNSHQLSNLDELHQTFSVPEATTPKPTTPTMHCTNLTTPTMHCTNLTTPTMHCTNLTTPTMHCTNLTARHENTFYCYYSLITV